MKNKKATGHDQIPVKVWDMLGDEGVRILRDIFNMVIRTGRMPEKWRRSILMQIYKGKGDVLSFSNYRGTSSCAIHLNFGRELLATG